MAKMDFGGVIENIITRDEFTVEKAREILKDETIAVKDTVYRARASPSISRTTVSTSSSASVPARPMRKR